MKILVDKELIDNARSSIAKIRQHLVTIGYLDESLILDLAIETDNHLLAALKETEEKLDKDLEVVSRTYCFDDEVINSDKNRHNTLAILDLLSIFLELLEAPLTPNRRTSKINSLSRGILELKSQILGKVK